MIDNKKFIADFVAAAKESDEEKMKTLAEQVKGEGLQDRVDLLASLVDELKKAEVDEQITTGLGATLELMRRAVETTQDSTSEEAKDTTPAEEVTQDVAATTGTEEADENVEESATPVADSEGEAPAEEVKAEKTEQ